MQRLLFYGELSLGLGSALQQGLDRACWHEALRLGCRSQCERSWFGFLCRVDDLEWPPRCSGHHQRKNHLKSSNSGQTAVCPELHFYGKSQDGKRQLTFVLFSISSRWRRTSRPAMRARPRSGGVPAARTPCGGSRSAMRSAPCPARRARWER